ncbi:MAG: polyprenyl synthetase family protein [SAR324 cluster bacterium]|nr:polyprenyl synthetase family protein [SAR324 cluster bacterium]MBL7035169.1 polyprenyl synthetase family protein [SAR324 cluster bacterium]
MEQVLCDRNELDSQNYLELVQIAVKENLGVSLPFMADIGHHMLTPHNNTTRTQVLLQSALLFDNPDAEIIDIGSTLEYLHTASALHRHIKEPENARRRQKHVTKLWGSEASVLLGDYLLSISFQILTRVGNLDVLEAISLATQNISRGQVHEISLPTLTATPEHWRKVTRDKIAGLFGAGAQSAAYWGKSSEATAAVLFDFGEHVGMATQFKTDLKALENKKLFQQKLQDRELWSPLCILIHECLPEDSSRKITEKLQSDFNVQELCEELWMLFKKYELSEMIQAQAVLELKAAEKCLEHLPMDTQSLQSLTKFSLI